MEWTEAEISDHYVRFRIGLEREHGLDMIFEDKLQTFMGVDPPGNCLRRIRETYSLSLSSVAQNAGLGVKDYHRYEKAEGTGKITLNALKACAQAMDCELVYALRPVNRRLPSENLFRQIAPFARRMRSWFLFAQALRLLRKASFRREMGWARNPPRSKFPNYGESQYRSQIWGSSSEWPADCPSSAPGTTAERQKP